LSSVDNFKRQHDDLVKVANEISGLLNPVQLSKDAVQVRTLLSTLAGKLKIHLAMEDKALYPKLLAHHDEVVRRTATQFMDEMGGISEAFTSYLNKWPTASVIQSNASTFVRETKEIFSALSMRIQKENNKLYPLVK